MMVPELPIFARQVLNIRPRGDNFSSGNEATKNLVERLPKRSFIVKMLEEVTREKRHAANCLPIANAIHLAARLAAHQLANSGNQYVHGQWEEAGNRGDHAR